MNKAERPPAEKQLDEMEKQGKLVDSGVNNKFDPKRSSNRDNLTKKQEK